MKRWEYKVGTESTITHMNTLGKEGWELVALAIVSSNEVPGLSVMQQFYKRPLKGKGWFKNPFKTKINP